MLTLVTGDLFNSEIADCLALAEQTVKTHVSRILAKLNVQAVAANEACLVG